MHEFMHTLVGTFVNKLDKVNKEGYQELYPINISLPPKYSRAIYFTNEEDRENWLKIL
jgi:hypothetical protein